MEMQEERRIPAARTAVWEALNDPEVLRQSMPGCESFEQTAENEYKALVTAKVGPVKSKFKFKLQLTDIDPPNGYVIEGEGQGGAAGFAKGSATVGLSEEQGETLLSYSVNARVGGKLAQLGGRLIDGTARKMADEFFDNFSNQLSAESETAAAREQADVGQEKPGLARAMRWVYGGAGLILLLLLLVLFA